MTKLNDFAAFLFFSVFWSNSHGVASIRQGEFI